jgi:hypothetical protein
MDAQQFDSLVRGLARASTRRDLLRSAVASVVSIVLAAVRADPATAQCVPEGACASWGAVRGCAAGMAGACGVGRSAPFAAPAASAAATRCVRSMTSAVLVSAAADPARPCVMANAAIWDRIRSPVAPASTNVGLGPRPASRGAAARMSDRPAPGSAKRTSRVPGAATGSVTAAVSGAVASSAAVRQTPARVGTLAFRLVSVVPIPTARRG